MNGEKELYIYKGPVLMFDKCVCMQWEGQTYAVSEAKAKQNLTYQYKKENNLLATANVRLSKTGKLNKK